MRLVINSTLYDAKRSQIDKLYALKGTRYKVILEIFLSMWALRLFWTRETVIVKNTSKLDNVSKCNPVTVYTTACKVLGGRCCVDGTAPKSGGEGGRQRKA